MFAKFASHLFEPYEAFFELSKDFLMKKLKPQRNMRVHSYGSYYLRRRMYLNFLRRAWNAILGDVAPLNTRETLRKAFPELNNDQIVQRVAVAIAEYLTPGNIWLLRFVEENGVERDVRLLCSADMAQNYDNMLRNSSVYFRRKKRYSNSSDLMYSNNAEFDPRLSTSGLTGTPGGLTGSNSMMMDGTNDDDSSTENMNNVVNNGPGSNSGLGDLGFGLNRRLNNNSGNVGPSSLGHHGLDPGEELDVDEPRRKRGRSNQHALLVEQDIGQEDHEEDDSGEDL
jgi:hypothetical protein